MTWCDKKLNSSVLLSSTRNKSFQFFGIAAEGPTLLRTPLPLICLVDATFLDGAALLQMLNPGTADTFLDYAEQVVLP